MKATKVQYLTYLPHVISLILFQNSLLKRAFSASSLLISILARLSSSAFSPSSIISSPSSCCFGSSSSPEQYLSSEQLSEEGFESLELGLKESPTPDLLLEFLDGRPARTPFAAEARERFLKVPFFLGSVEANLEPPEPLLEPQYKAEKGSAI